MDRQRFDQLLEAYGADFARWPDAERDAGAAFAAAYASEIAPSLAGARALDASLDAVRVEPLGSDLLAARILAAHKRNRGGGFDWRAAAALAACAVFGVLLGYGGGLMAPLAEDEAAYVASAFEAPLADIDGEEG